jgi:tetratricopeptide (TPR) repeat protein
MVEDEPQRKKLAADFIYCLRSKLTEVPVSPAFALVEAPQYMAERVQTTEAAMKFISSMKCRILIFGRTRVRSINRIETNVLELRVVVAHKEIARHISDVFAKEITEIFLPSKVQTPTDNDVFIFEITAQWVNFAAQYFIAMASLLSGEYPYAVSILESLETQLKTITINLNQIAELKKRVPMNLGRIHIAQAAALYGKWRKNRDAAHLVEMKSHLDEVERRIPEDYSLLLLKCIYSFVVERNLRRASDAINQCKQVKDPTWRYSKAFLDAYKGKMNDAERAYRAAFKLEGPAGMYLEVEEFLDWMVHEEPSKVQLHYCLGLINYHLKGDRERAREDFNRFLDSTSEKQFPEQTAKAREYLVECGEKALVKAATNH